jgi:hypothetical protein
VLATVPRGERADLGVDCEAAGDGLRATVRSRSGTEAWTWDGAGEPLRSAR